MLRGVQRLKLTALSGFVISLHLRYLLEGDAVDESPVPVQ
jgi:hypothetical protein